MRVGSGEHVFSKPEQSYLAPCVDRLVFVSTIVVVIHRGRWRSRVNIEGVKGRKN
jgi:hypothetical protein